MGQVADFEINEMLEPAHKNRGDGEVVAIRTKLYEPHICVVGNEWSDNLSYYLYYL